MGVARAALRLDARHLRRRRGRRRDAPTADKEVDNDTTDKRDSDFPVLVVTGTAAYLVWQDVSTQTAVVPT